MRSRPVRIALTILLALLAALSLRYLETVDVITPFAIALTVTTAAFLWGGFLSFVSCFATTNPTPAAATPNLVRYQTLPAPSGLDAEVMRLLEPGKRTDLRLLLCKSRDCGAVLITHHEYWPDATSDTEYATDLGWREIKVPDKPFAWYCPNHVKSTQDLLG